MKKYKTNKEIMNPRKTSYLNGEKAYLLRRPMRRITSDGRKQLAK
jgi:hypothetical protein